MLVKIIPYDKDHPPDKLADAELCFDYDLEAVIATLSPATPDGQSREPAKALRALAALAGLKLVGFSIWEHRPGQRTVTFPARTYAVNGGRRTFSLLRAIEDEEARNRLREAILGAYTEFEAKGERAEPS